MLCGSLSSGVVTSQFGNIETTPEIARCQTALIPADYGGSQCLDHETGKIRCIQTDAAGSDQSRRAIVETLTRFFMVVEVEVAGQSSLQWYHRVILSEIDVPSVGAAPEPFAKNIFQGAAATVHDDLDVDC